MTRLLSGAFALLMFALLGFVAYEMMLEPFIKEHY